MDNFTFYNPVKIYFGKGQITTLKDAIPKQSRVMVTYGQGSIKQNGIYDQIMHALSDFNVIEFGGIEPNPSYETLMSAIQLARKEKIDFLLAVGGGSVIDGTKFIAAAAPFKGDEWDILAKHAKITQALPLGCVLTLPAAGSEFNSGAVISKKATNDKLVFGSSLVFPRFAVLDPLLTCSLSPRQTTNGIIDAFVHTTEQYLTYPADAPLQDRFAEGILHTLIEEAPKVLQNPQDYNARANIMWCAAMALNGIIGIGVPQDWSTHMIGHEITACFGLDHGQTLAIILPSVLRVQRTQKHVKLLQYGERIFGITHGNEDDRIENAITKTSDFFSSLGVKLKLRDYSIGETAVNTLLKQLERHEMVALGEQGKVDLAESAKILKDAL